jgi:hypothetical protein
LNALTPNDFTHAINLLEAYPDTFSAYARGEDGEGYYAAFHYAMLVQREALMRYPNAPTSDEWFWRLAVNQARSGDGRAAASFSALVAKALDNKTITLDSLTDWGKSQYPAAVLEVIPLAEQPAYLSSNLVKISLSPDSGGAFLWLLEKSDGFESYPLTALFDFIHSTQVDYFTADLSGDGNPEVGIVRSTRPGDTRYLLPQIFDLASLPPRPMTFAAHPFPEIGPDFHNHWEVTPDGILQFKDILFVACPATVQHRFAWNGSTFQYNDASYTLQPDPSLLAYCAPVIDHAERSWGIELALQLMEKLTPFWPPDADIYGNPYPEDELDRWRYRLSLYHALLGNQAEARAAMQTILAAPAIPNSRWTTTASDFLETYKQQGTIYRACLLSELCNLRLALQSLVGTFSPADYSLAPQVLEKSGVVVRSSGFFDFDGDKTTERWVVVRHRPLEALEFWILAPTDSGFGAFFVAYVTSDRLHVTYFDAESDPPIVQIEQGIHFTFQPRPAAITLVEPAFTLSADLYLPKLNALEDRLLAGDDPAAIRQALLDLKATPNFPCNSQLCPQLVYLLGLASELQGNATLARDAFLELWRRYPGSPYTIIARLKLRRTDITSTPTSTITLTITPTPTKTPTPTITLTATPTPEFTASATATSLAKTPTPTLGAYPPPATAHPSPSAYPPP